MNDMDLAVLEFMRENPLTATYIKTTTGEYDPASGEMVSTSVEIGVQAILMDLTLQSNGLSAKYGTLVEAGDKEIYIRPPNKTDPEADILDVDPTSDRIKVGNILYKIHSFKELNPTGSDPILYTLYIKR